MRLKTFILSFERDLASGLGNSVGISRRRLLKMQSVNMEVSLSKGFIKMKRSL